MEQRFHMRLAAKQTIDGETQALLMETTALFTGTPERYELRYRDEGGDLHGVKNILRVEAGKSVTLLRSGEYATHLIIEKGIRHLSQYSTPYGAMMIGVSGTDLRSDVTQHGGSLMFRYCTDVELTPIGEFEFHITLS
mgnify:CR=1 FL=1